MADVEDTPTNPETPQAKADAEPQPLWWTRNRKWVVDGAVVAGIGAAVYRGILSAETAVPIVVAVLLAHAPPQSTAAETATKALLEVLPRLLRRGKP